MATLHDDACQAMLTRLAGDLAVLAAAPWLEWTCCWQPFSHVTVLGATERWTWRFCNGGMPGEMTGRPCGHWHHQHEFPPMAGALVPAR